MQSLTFPIYFKTRLHAGVALPKINRVHAGVAAAKIKGYLFLNF